MNLSSIYFRLLLTLLAFGALALAVFLTQTHI